VRLDPRRRPHPDAGALRARRLRQSGTLETHNRPSRRRGVVDERPVGQLRSDGALSSPTSPRPHRIVAKKGTRPGSVPSRSCERAHECRDSDRAGGAGACSEAPGESSRSRTRCTCCARLRQFRSRAPRPREGLPEARLRRRHGGGHRLPTAGLHRGQHPRPLRGGGGSRRRAARPRVRREPRA